MLVVSWSCLADVSCSWPAGGLENEAVGHPAAAAGGLHLLRYGAVQYSTVHYSTVQGATQVHNRGDTSSVICPDFGSS